MPAPAYQTMMARQPIGEGHYRSANDPDLMRLPRRLGAHALGHAAAYAA